MAQDHTSLLALLHDDDDVVRQNKELWHIQSPSDMNIVNQRSEIDRLETSERAEELKCLSLLSSDLWHATYK